MDQNPNIEVIQESLEKDDLLNRLEKFSVFLDTLVYRITEEEMPEEDVSKIVDHIKLQKKIYEHAHNLYDTVKDENYEKEKAEANLNILKETLEEYSKFRNFQK
ncbi:hypothetical protein AAJ76_200051644 [Vairimorpha ceranae]|uniref:Uncharacterized protein n=1 Tax=Vairimorpha ceranae TaxID=40302 RepID=A0A0F9WUW1_9MICR|nr:hypothetical protein AAJ76_200051644 [Vairimorpha ceranae]KKO76528.1 hypothetical protein AAJ76_200051644 [Vairimorpha ceranae]